MKYTQALLPNTRNANSASFGAKKEHIQLVTSSDCCTLLNYSLRSTNTHEVIYLTTTEQTLKYYKDAEEVKAAIEEYKRTDVIPTSLLTVPVFVNVTILLPCPLGFTLVGNPPRCDCYPQLLIRNITCTILNGTGYLLRRGSNWIGTHENVVLLGAHCKPDYCTKRQVLVDIVNNPDVQCSFNHSGILCGGCKEGHSMAIGSSHCIYCPNNHNAALVLFFISAGPLLYLFIASLDITVTKGSINGVLLYANIVWIYHNVLLSTGMESTTTSARAMYVFKVFIAWINLDFGIETCFVNGLDAYWKSLLQYVFPMYLWLIAYTVVLVYRYTNIQQRFPRASRLLGKPTDVLVTFILVSYTKFIRNIQDAFRFAVLTNFPDNSTETLWALDGNVKYFKSKHAVLFVMASLALLISLIFSFYLLAIGLKSVSWCVCKRMECHRRHLDCPCLRREEDTDRELSAKCECVLKVGQKFSSLDIPLPLHDALYAPFNGNHKYWLALMLFVRIVLLVIFSSTYNLTSGLSPFVLLLVSTLLLVYIAFNRVYKSANIQMLEAISLGNLIFFSSGILYSNFIDNGELKSAFACVSTGIAFLQFSGIIASNIMAQFKLKKIFVSKNGNEARQTVRSAPVEQGGVCSKRLVDLTWWRESLLNEENDDDADSADDERDPLLGHSQPERKLICFQCFKK